MAYIHTPAMPHEVLYFLDCKPGRIYVDCTLGGAGHAVRILEKIMPDGLLIGIDQDQDAIRHAETALAAYAGNVRLVHDNFANLAQILSIENIDAVDGILVDLGLSQHHLEASGRGFSFKRDEALDMRMNSGSGPTAEEMVNRLCEHDLAGIFRDYGEERWSRQIARRIVKVRTQNPIRSSGQLARIISEAVPKQALSQRIHPATRAFMALRIVVNQELDRLRTLMQHAVELLKPKGRLCVLAFHSLEDRIVKQHFKALAKGCTCPPDLPRCACGRLPTVRILTRKAQQPTAREIAANPMARSTRLRALEKI